MTAQQDRILIALRRAGLIGLTPHELMSATGGIIGYRQRVTELRRMGFDIQVLYEGKTRQGATLNRYRLHAEPQGG